MLARKRHFAALKESKENFVKKNRRFVVTEFVKTCDELVIDQQSISSEEVSNVSYRRSLSNRHFY